MSASAAQQYLAQNQLQHLAGFITSGQVAKAQLAGAKEKKLSEILQATSASALGLRGTVKSGKKVARHLGGLKSAVEDLQLRGGTSIGEAVKNHGRWLINKEEGGSDIKGDPGSILNTFEESGAEPEFEDTGAGVGVPQRFTGAKAPRLFDFEPTGQIKELPAGHIEGLAQKETPATEREVKLLSAPEEEAGSAVKSAVSTGAKAVGKSAVTEAAEATTAVAGSQGFLDPISDVISGVADIAALGSGIASAVEGIRGEKKSEEAVQALKPAPVSGFQKIQSAF